MPVTWIPREVRRKHLGTVCEKSNPLHPTWRGCGITAADHKKFTGFGLQLHHMDLDRTNNDPSNFVTACRKCHTEWHWAYGKDKQSED